MSITRADVNADITAKITSKTTPLSLSQTEDGANREYMMDYLDQEILTVTPIAKTIKVTITHAELLALHDTPKEILPAVTDVAYLPLHFMFKFNNNSGWGQSGTPWVVALGSTSLGSFTMQMGGGTITEQIVLGTGGNTNTSDTYFNKAITITANVNPATPSNVLATCDVYVTYFEIEL